MHAIASACAHRTLVQLDPRPLPGHRAVGEQHAVDRDVLPTRGSVLEFTRRVSTSYTRFVSAPAALPAHACVSISSPSPHWCPNSDAPCNWLGTRQQRAYAAAHARCWGLEGRGHGRGRCGTLQAAAHDSTSWQHTSPWAVPSLLVSPTSNCCAPRRAWRCAPSRPYKARLQSRCRRAATRSCCSCET